MPRLIPTVTPYDLLLIREALASGFPVTICPPCTYSRPLDANPQTWKESITASVASAHRAKRASTRNERAAQRRAEIAALYDSGLTAKQIAALRNEGPHGVESLLKDIRRERRENP